MSTHELLGVYLNDHLAGSASGIELARKLRDQSDGPDAQFFNDICERIEADRDTLENVMAALDVSRNPIKEAAGWMLEKVSRLKLNAALSGSTELKRMTECETLSLGVEGKRQMWIAVNEVYGGDVRLIEFNLPNLIRRAEEQRAGLEQRRLAAARECLVEDERVGGATG
jgi:hypothetical protein